MYVLVIEYDQWKQQGEIHCCNYLKTGLRWFMHEIAITAVPYG